MLRASNDHILSLFSLLSRATRQGILYLSLLNDQLSMGTGVKIGADWA